MPNNKILTPKTINETFTNTETNAIYVSEDKLRLCLKDYEKEVKDTPWMLPFSITVSLGVSLFTATFDKDILGIKSYGIEIIFWFVFMCSIIWLICCLFKRFFYKKQ